MSYMLEAAIADDLEISVRSEKRGSQTSSRGLRLGCSVGYGDGITDLPL